MIKDIRLVSTGAFIKMIFVTHTIRQIQVLNPML